MAYPLLESPLGNKYYYNGEYIDSNSETADSLMNPTDEVTYYETIRIKDGVLLFLEDHLNRLKKSVEGIENFAVDLKKIEDDSYAFMKNCASEVKEGNLRVVLTKSQLLIHICEAFIPVASCFENGVNSMILKWERVAPNIKVFRGDYKTAVADVFASSNEFGHPYEVLLTDNDNKLYEGSKSNLFVIVGNEVYSAPDDKILLGITRNRVLSSLEKAGGKLVIGTFTLEEIKGREDVAVFVSSTPFDILPIAHIDGIPFNSANNELLRKISAAYLANTDDYIAKAKSKHNL